MAERVTRQFADVPSGEPVIGGLFRLVNLTDSADTPRDMLEATDPDFPGRYYTVDGEDLAPGVWQVQRNSGAGYLPTGEEIHVSPRRVNAGEISSENTDTTFIDYVVADVVRAAAFVPVGTAPGTPILPYLQTAVNYAASKGFRKVYVGNWGDRNLWEGAAQLNLTAIPGIALDLGGAEISRTGGLTPLSMAGGTVRGGLIAGTGNSNQIINTTDTVSCEDVVFGEHLGATVQNGAGYAAARFVRCTGHRLWPESLADAPTRFQVTDTMTLDKDNGAFQPPHEANVDAGQLGGFFQEALTVAATTAPGDTVAPFDTSLTMARALKHLWFLLRPAVQGDLPSTRVVKKAAGLVSLAHMGLYEATSGTSTPASTFSVLLQEAGFAPVDVDDASVDPGWVATINGPYDTALYGSIDVEAFFKVPAAALTLPATHTFLPRGEHAVAGWAPNVVEVDLQDLATAYPGVFTGQWAISAEMDVFRAGDGGATLIQSRKFSGWGKVRAGRYLSAIFMVDPAGITSPRELEPGSWWPGNHVVGSAEGLASGVGYVGQVPWIPYEELGVEYGRLRFHLKNAARTDLPRFT